MGRKSSINWKTNLSRVNKFRSRNRVSPLKLSSELNHFANWKAQYLCKTRKLAHENKFGNLEEQANRLGIKVNYFGENLSGASRRPDWKMNNAITSWMRSKKGHKEFLLNPNIKYAGFGKCKGYCVFVGAANISEKRKKLGTLPKLWTFNDYVLLLIAIVLFFTNFEAFVGYLLAIVILKQRRKVRNRQRKGKKRAKRRK